MENPFVLEYDSDTDPPKEYGGSISYSDIAQKLIKDRLLLTALELHAELIESGKEIPKLREFFSNPGNFENQTKSELSPCIPRSSSQATLDSLDFTRFSEDGERGVDERVAVLEFELRKAKETINSLRTNLTVAAETETTLISGKIKSKSSLNEPIKPHELRALNFLINEYLLIRGYKLTSITFADENENQDFEDWDDVGLNLSKPAELLHLYRAGLRQTGYDTSDTAVQTDEFDLQLTPVQDNENIELRERIQKLEIVKEELIANLDRYEKTNESRTKTCVEVETQSDDIAVSETGTECNMTKTSSRADDWCEIDFVEDKSEGELVRVEKSPTASESHGLVYTLDLEHDTLDNIEITSEDSLIDVKHSSVNNSPLHSVIMGKQVMKPPVTKEARTQENFMFSSGFESEVWREVSSQIDELNNVDSITPDVLVRLLGNVLIQYSRALITCKSESVQDIVTLMVYAIHLHPDSAKQEALLNFLLNLKKRPQEDDRNLILAGVVKLAQVSTEEVVQGQLLSQCWELMTHKYPEKRLLVAQASALIAPYLSSELRDSLLVSMLQQLLDDREDSVKIACIKSLAVITSVISDTDKYFQMEDLAMKGLEDPSDKVVEITVKLLLPVLARWALRLDKFHSHLTVSIISMIKKYVKEGKESRWVWCMNALTSLLPFVVMYTATAPEVLEYVSQQLPPAQPRPGFAELCRGLCNPLLFCQGKEYTVGMVMSSFDYCILNNKYWPQIDWVLNSMLPSLLDLVTNIDGSNEDCVNAMIKFYRSFCYGFGTAITLNQVRTMFIERLQKLEAELMIVSRDWPSTSIVPVYLLAVLAPVKSEETELGKTLEKFLIALALCGAPLHSLKFAVRELCKQQHISDTIMSAIWQGVVHQRGSVRRATVEILSETIVNCLEQVVINHVLPALITLASDPDLSVRTSTVPVFGLIIEHSSNKEMLDKTYLQIHSIVADSALKENHSTLLNVITVLSKMAPHCDPSFREEVIVGELSTFVGFTMDLHSGAKKMELAAALVEAYSNTVYCQISKQNISNILLPALRLLENICNESLQTHTETVSSMIREVESRIESTKQPMQRSGSNMSLGMATSNMEDMKQRVSKIFNSPISKPAHLPNLPNLFKKK